jgi:hypothetical protein
MDGSRFEVWTQAQGRRGALASLLTGGLGLLTTAEAVARKKHKKRKRKKKPNPLSCAEQCTADACFHRTYGPPLCGNHYGVAACMHCSSDQACVDSDFPYCITSFTESDDNETHQFPGCGDYDVGLCAFINV